ncbi:MAG: acetolactate synthase small subunit [Clostridium sp.]|jgi:acetolactate synthase, small subunit|nr:acetolactate synthase small subunit [Clostridium sp.]
MNNKNHVISVLVKDEAGIVSRVSGLFSGRGYSIESITAAQTNEKGYARLTIETSGGDADVIEQITKQLNRLIPVLKVIDLGDVESIERELILCKVNAKDEDRSEILRIAEIFGAKIIDVTPRTYTLQAIGDERQIRSLVELLRPIGIRELVRSGKVGITRANQFATTGSTNGSSKAE